MTEYISREAIIKELEEEIEAGDEFDEEDVLINEGLKIALKDIKNQPSADVQSAPKWISVKDRLPDKFDNVLCYCKTTTGEGNEFMFGAYHNDTWWLKTCRTYATLEQPQMRVMYWMPLPKPPKDGEHND